MKTSARLSFFTFVAVTFTFLFSNAQTATTTKDSVDLLSLSLEDLVNVRIVSASRTDESVFEAPVSSYVITRNEIVNSGATSIPEALRLAPALIVREMANGSYDVSIRGGKDNLASHQYWSLNTSILAMIDNRMIFNYYYGGTYWQSLPVDIADVERIEIVYGPNSPLYGPNAVDGVINIITRKRMAGSDTYGSASVQAGENLLFSVLGGKKISNKLEMNISANHSDRKRMKREHFDPATNTFITNLQEHSYPLLASNPNAYYPDPETGSRRTGMNFNLYFTPRRKTTVTLNSSYNESLGMIGSNYGPILQQLGNTSLSNMVKAEVENFTIQTSIIQGQLATNGDLTAYKYNYLTWDNYLDYNLKINKKLSFRPSVSYQKAVIDDKPYSVDIGKKALFNNSAYMYNYAFSLKADYSPFKSLRIIGAVRADKFRAPDDTYISYQAIANYKIGKKGIIRFLAGRSFAGSFIEATYINFTAVDEPVMKVVILGNEDRKLLQNDILELGYKMQLRKNVSFDFNIFRQFYINFAPPVSGLVRPPSFMPLQQGETHVLIKNIALESEQIGATFSANFLLGKVTLKPSVTYQKTQLKNHTAYYADPHPVFAPVYNTDNAVDEESKYAPNVFGGFSLNVPVHKWNFNLSGYYYSQYRLEGLNSRNLDEGGLIPRDIENIQGKFLLNANVGYDFSTQVKAFVNARNILAQDARESYGTDRIGTLLFAGITIKL